TGRRRKSPACLAPRLKRTIAGAARAAYLACGGSLVVGLEIHALIQGSNLFGIAIEHERAALGREKPVFADAPLGGLAPARMRHVGVHVGVKAIFAGSRQHP